MQFLSCFIKIFGIYPRHLQNWSAVPYNSQNTAHRLSMQLIFILFFKNPAGNKT